MNGHEALLFVDLPDKPPRKASPTWAAMIKRVYEVDPLTCARCGAAMKIIASLSNPSEINKICDNLGLQSWRAPPPWPTKPRSIEPTVVPLFDHLEFQHLN